MRRNVPTYVSISACIIIVLGIIASIMFPKLEDFLLDEATALKEGSPAYSTWKRVPFPFKFKIYLFNVTNPEDVQIGLNPILKEIGPYIYDEFRTREVMEIDEENDTIKYTQRRLYYFNQKESACRTESDIITILNTGFVGIVNKINEKAPMALPMLEEALPYLYPGMKNIFTIDSVKNILFDGMKISCESEEAAVICGALESRLPPTIRKAGKNYLVSMFYHLNGSEDGPYIIERGSKGSRGQIVAFKNANHLNQWGDDGRCSAIKGTDLTVNARFSIAPKTIDFFAADFCLSLSLDFNATVIQHGEIEAYSFQSGAIFKNCLAGDDSNTVNISPCVETPIVISQPHFLNSDKSLLDYAQGLEPAPAQHGSFLKIEPTTGLTLLAQTRIQMNMALQQIESVQMLQNVSQGLFPFLWLEEGAEVPEIFLDKLVENLGKFKIFHIVKYVLIILGIVLLVAAVVLSMIQDGIICQVRNDNRRRVNAMDQAVFNNKEGRVYMVGNYVE